MVYFVDYYLLLEVSPDANTTEIKKAFKKLALKWHPDRNNGIDTTEKMRNLLEAKMILENISSRKKYDEEYNSFYSSYHKINANSVEDKNEKVPYNDKSFEESISEAQLESEKLLKDFIIKMRTNSKVGFWGFIDGINDFFYHL